MRPQREKILNLQITIPVPHKFDYKGSIEPLAINPHPEVDLSHIKIPYHLTKEIISHFPAPKNNPSRVLDIGCADAVHREICEAAGFEYFGIDIIDDKAPILADAQALPFLDASFDFLLGMNVLEHIQHPFMMMQEAYRVLSPGGKMIGTVSFMEPFHEDSFYHHSPLGTWATATYVPFEVDHLCPADEGWSALYAISSMALYPHMPRIFTKMLVAPLQWLHRFWYWLGDTFLPKADRVPRTIRLSGDFLYIVHKPPA